jgi:hypothetical protein
VDLASRLVSPSISFRSDTGLTKTAIAFYSDFPSKKRFEFETLDDQAPLDETGMVIAWPDGVPITDREKALVRTLPKASLDASHADYLCYHAFAIRRDHDHTAAKDRQPVGYAFKAAGTIR